MKIYMTRIGQQLNKLRSEAKRNYFDVVLESFVIVLSITLAFQVEALQTFFSNKKVKQDLIEASIYNMMQDYEQLGKIIDYGYFRTQNLHYMDSLINSSGLISESVNDSTYLHTTDEPFMMLQSLISLRRHMPAFTFNDESFKALIANGHLNSENDRRLKWAFEEYYGRAEELNSEILDEYILNFNILTQNLVPFSVYDRFANTPFVEMFDQKTGKNLTYQIEEINTLLSEMRKNEEVKKFLSIYYQQIRDYMLNVDLLRSDIENLEYMLINIYERDIDLIENTFMEEYRRDKNYRDDFRYNGK